MSLRVKTTGIGPIAKLKPTPKEQRPASASSSSSSSSASPTRPTGLVKLNPKAWVLLMSLGYSMCNDRSRFRTFHKIEPLETTAGTTAYGIGEVTLEIRKNNGRKGKLVVKKVLYVPENMVNTVTIGGLIGKGGCCEGGGFDTATGLATDRNRRQMAWFPTSEETTANLWCLKLVGEFDRLWPAATPDDRRPKYLSFSCFAVGEPVLKTAVAAEHDAGWDNPFFPTTDGFPLGFW